LSSTTQQYQFSSNVEIIPNSVNFNVVVGGVAYTISDDGKGGLIASPGLLAPSITVSSVLYTTGVNYTTGVITVVFNATIAASGDSLSMTAAANQSDMQNVNRFKTVQYSIEVSTYLNC